MAIITAEKANTYKDKAIKTQIKKNDKESHQAIRKLSREIKKRSKEGYDFASVVTSLNYYSASSWLKDIQAVFENLGFRTHVSMPVLTNEKSEITVYWGKEE